MNTVSMARFPMPTVVADPTDSYRCVICSGMMWEECADAHELDLQICYDADCLEKRIARLKSYERVVGRINELLKARQYTVTPEQFRAEILAVALAAEHYGA